MAYNNCASALFLIVLLFTASNPLVNGQILQSPSLITGRLCCTPDGNCPVGAQGINGTRVSLNCTILGTIVTVGQNITSANGTFSITVPSFLGSIFGFSMAPCVAFVRLPLNSTVCPVLSTTNGILVSTLRAVYEPIIEFVRRFVLTGFVRVAI